MRMASPQAFHGARVGQDVFYDAESETVGVVGAAEHPRVGAFVRVLAPDQVIVETTPGETVLGANARAVIDVESREPYRRLASTPIEDQLGRPCGCAACERDGAHEPACGVHEVTELADGTNVTATCDCGKNAVSRVPECP